MRLLAIILVVCVVLGGCYKANDNRINVQEGIRGDTLESNIITRPIGGVISLLIGEGVEINNVHQQVNDSGFLEVQVRGYNHSTLIKRFDYKAEWLDKSGMVINTKTSTWLPMSAMRKSEFGFKVIAPSKEAVDFRINTRMVK